MRSKRTVVFTRSADLYRALRAVHKDLRARLREIPAEALRTAHTEAVNIALDERIVHSGEYIDRFRVVMAPEDAGGSLVNDSEYAGVIEYGRRPGARRPPIEPIREWVVDKLGIPWEEAWPVAVAIANNIARRGTPPRRVMLRAGQAAQARIRELLGNTADADRLAKLLVRFR